MTISKVQDSIVIAEVIPGGNAAEAGLQRGDAILQVGGAKLLSIEEMDAIAKSMSGGDRVEFEFSRRGRKSKEFVQFGQPAPLPPPGDAPAIDPAKTSASSNSQRRSIHDNQPAATSGLQSVFDSPSTAPVTGSGKIELELPPLQLDPPN